MAQRDAVLPSSRFFEDGRGSKEGSLISELLSDGIGTFGPVKFALQSRDWMVQWVVLYNSQQTVGRGYDSHRLYVSFSRACALGTS